MDWTERLRSAIEYLEAGLEEPMDIEHAASLANCSLFHFMRMFEIVCGVTPGEYVRRRRLSRAAIDLAATDERVVDLALRYGYETPEAFAKAFKRLFGMTPSEARQPGAALQLYPRLSLTVVITGDRVMRYRIVEKPTFTVVGVSLHTSTTDANNLKEIPTFWKSQSANGNVDRLAKAMSDFGLLGICHNFNPKSETFEYLIGIEAPPNGASGLPAQTVRVEIPGATYAVHESVGPMPKAIQDTWKRAFTEWFPESGFEHAGSPDFEVYPPNVGSKGDPMSPDYVCEVWIPVKRRT